MLIIILCISIILLLIALSYLRKKIGQYETTIEKQYETINEQRSEICHLKTYCDASSSAISQIRREYELYQRLFFSAKEKLRKYEQRQSELKP